MPARAPIEEVLGDRLREIDSQGLRRRIRTVTSRAGATVECDGARLVSFASNDYLGLASHPAVVNAAVEGARRHGAGSTASRLICGTSSAMSGVTTKSGLRASVLVLSTR